ncbi:hypothetical protein FQR65_LT19091 [Abscondita terminalis]|nr:hypothetical protein FQR65_LT19091 [Abscondita terminalis]
MQEIAARIERAISVLYDAILLAIIAAREIAAILAPSNTGLTKGRRLNSTLKTPSSNMGKDLIRGRHKRNKIAKARVTALSKKCDDAAYCRTLVNEIVDNSLLHDRKHDDDEYNFELDTQQLQDYNS